MAGLWFEDFTPGTVIDHAITRTITEADNMFFCSLTYNPHRTASPIRAEKCRNRYHSDNLKKARSAA